MIIACIAQCKRPAFRLTSYRATLQCVFHSLFYKSTSPFLSLTHLVCWLCVPVRLIWLLLHKLPFVHLCQLTLYTFRCISCDPCCEISLVHLYMSLDFKRDFFHSCCLFFCSTPFCVLFLISLRAHSLWKRGTSYVIVIILRKKNKNIEVLPVSINKSNPCFEAPTLCVMSPTRESVNIFCVDIVNLSCLTESDEWHFIFE